MKKRLQLIEEIIGIVNGDLTRDYVEFERKQVAQVAMQEKARFQRAEDGESDETRHLGNNQVVGLQKTMLSEQDRQLGDIVKIV